VRNGWVRPTVGQTERPDHVSFTIENKLKMQKTVGRWI